VTVASAGPHALHYTQVTTISTSSLNFYRLDTLPVTQPTVSEHWKQQRDPWNIWKLMKC